jgi:hypothetical protein
MLVRMEQKWDHATNSSGSRLGRLSQTPETSEQVSRPKREKQVSAGSSHPKGTLSYAGLRAYLAKGLLLKEMALGPRVHWPQSRMHVP